MYQLFYLIYIKTNIVALLILYTIQVIVSILKLHSSLHTYLDTWSGFVAAIRLFHGRAGDSTIVEKFLEPSDE